MKELLEGQRNLEELAEKAAALLGREYAEPPEEKETTTLPREGPEPPVEEMFAHCNELGRGQGRLAGLLYVILEEVMKL